jgi:hypothetical protein
MPRHRLPRFFAPGLDERPNPRSNHYRGNSPNNGVEEDIFLQILDRGLKNPIIPYFRLFLSPCQQIFRFLMVVKVVTPMGTRPGYYQHLKTLDSGFRRNDIGILFEIIKFVLAENPFPLR